MLKVDMMSAEEMQALLHRAKYGHLGCTRDGHPYVVPMHYAYDAGDLYFFTTEGTKTEFIAANHEVCFQVEEVFDHAQWSSVMLIGEAHRLLAPDELEHAMQLMTRRNPTLTPAISKMDVGPWHRLSKIAVYRIRPSAVYGRKTI